MNFCKEFVLQSLCPRCLGFIPNNKTPGLYPGAMSRVDNRTEICSECGIEEAMNYFTAEPLPDISLWPLATSRKVFSASQVQGLG